MKPRVIALTVLAIALILTVPVTSAADKMTDEEFTQYLVTHSPYTGEWQTRYGAPGRFSSTYTLEIVNDGGLTATFKETKYVIAPPSPWDKPWDGAATEVKVKKGKLSLRAPDGAEIELKLKDGALTGQSYVSAGPGGS